MWNKFMRPSNRIDLVLHDFDNAYNWAADTRPGKPYGLNGGAPKLRWLYKTFSKFHRVRVEVARTP
jgi:hypothetical protein